jgi:hypothetical protein
MYSISHRINEITVPCHASLYNSICTVLAIKRTYNLSWCLYVICENRKYTRNRTIFYRSYNLLIKHLSLPFSRRWNQHVLTFIVAGKVLSIKFTYEWNLFINLTFSKSNVIHFNELFKELYKGERKVNNWLIKPTSWLQKWRTK